MFLLRAVIIFGVKIIFHKIAGGNFFNKFIFGNKIIIPAFYIPRAQYTKVEDEDRDGLQLAKSSFNLNGSPSFGDDELTILAL